MSLAALQAKYTSLRAQMNDLTKAVAARPEDQRNFTTEEATKFDAVKAEIETVKKNIDRMTFAEGENRSSAANPNAQIDPASDQGDNPLGIPEKDLSKYSVMRAIRCLADRKPVDGLEGEVSREIAKRSGKDPQGFFMYGSAISAIESRAAHARLERRDLNLTTGVGGINQAVLYQSFIEKLRHRTVIDKVGARFMAGLVGKLYIPRQSGAGSAYWVGEGSAPTASNQTIDQVTLQPTTLGAYTDITRQFINQTSLDAESLVRDDLAKVMGIEIDRAALQGDGTSNAPTGIGFAAGINHVHMNGAALAWTDVVAQETVLAGNDIALEVETMAYVTTNKVRGALKTTLRSSVANAKFIWDDDNTVNGYPALWSNNMQTTEGPAGSEAGGTDSSIIFADWSNLIVGMWGGLDILVDPYTGSNTGKVRIVALQDIDIKIRHVEAFTITDGVLA